MNAARRLLKRTSIWLYCHRLAPSALVAWLFAAFNLRSL
jgi:hypothetical protein